MFAVLLSHGHYYVTIVNRHDSTWWWCFYHMGITLVMVVHHVGNGGAFITWALRFIVIAITIQHVCGAFIAWALLWSQCFRKMSHRRLSDITIVNRHDWMWWWCFYRMGITLVMVVLSSHRNCDSTQSPLPFNVIAVLLSHGHYYDQNDFSIIPVAVLFIVLVNRHNSSTWSCGFYQVCAFNIIAVLLHQHSKSVTAELEEGGRWHTKRHDILLCWVGRRWKITTTQRGSRTLYLYIFFRK